MITYFGLGYWGYLIGIPAAVIVRFIPRHTAAGRYGRRAVWAWLAVTVAIVFFSY